MDLLSDLIAEIDWCEFEARADGTIALKYKLGMPCTLVHMRVGTYLNKPMQAIMAAGQYVRMRDAGRYANCYLKMLDPERPQLSLYEIEPIERQLLAGQTRPLWQPIDPHYTQYQQAFMQQAQYAQAQQLAQHNQAQQQTLAQAQSQTPPGWPVLTTNNSQWPLGGTW